MGVWSSQSDLIVLRKLAALCCLFLADKTSSYILQYFAASKEKMIDCFLTVWVVTPSIQVYDMVSFDSMIWYLFALVTESVYLPVWRKLPHRLEHFLKQHFHLNINKSETNRLEHFPSQTREVLISKKTSLHAGTFPREHFQSQIREVFISTRWITFFLSWK